ncbi:cache domain-containing sensor histidine kinase [Parablautia muri]|uniref:Sensor histidine kinase n=1 Tax=Parablautia muri TaxID=2320879 RepID=A0A9X5BHG5_9FIRM|nr:sensor histidine kinase [Parablautia muri]NBJ94140.1 sensor histidine kinase [Parablautia muri]
MRRYLRGMNLQKKILFSNVLLFALPCLILSWQIISFVQTEANQRLNQSRLAILNQINRNMEDMLKNIVVYSDFFFSNAEVNGLLSQKRYESDYEARTTEKAMQEFLRSRWVYYGDTGYYLEILGENGRNYSSRWNDEVEFIFSDLNSLKKEDWYDMLLESGRIRYIPTYRSEEFGKDKDSIVRAVRLLRHLNSGRYIGLMDVSIQQERFERLFRDGIRQENQKVFLMDETGRIISCTDQELTGSYISSQTYLGKLLDYDHGYFPANIEGIYSQICFTTNSVTGWKIVMYETMQKSAWFGNWSYLWMVGVAVIYFLLALLMSIYNARYISHPVQKLKEDMRTAYQGDLSVRAQVESNDEFGQLGSQFNQMLDRIEELIRQLGERDEEKRVLELNALQAQINPHFLYNTLASIRFLMEMDMKEKANISLLALAKLLKKTFSDYRELIPVKEEMESLENYLVLMENRYQDMFEWEIQMDRETEECLVPRISVQPLVENSISHGFGAKKEMGKICVKARKEGEELIISVYDNGEGADLHKIKTLLASKKDCQEGQVSSIGIRNVQERIRLSFGDESGLFAYQLENGGIRIDMRMPARTAGALQGGSHYENHHH